MFKYVSQTFLQILTDTKALFLLEAPAMWKRSHMPSRTAMLCEVFGCSFSVALWVTVAFSALWAIYRYATFSWMYLLAGCFKETGMAFIVYVCVNLFFGINTIITHSVVFLLSQEKAMDQVGTLLILNLSELQEASCWVWWLWSGPQLVGFQVFEVNQAEDTTLRT